MNNLSNQGSAQHNFRGGNAANRAQSKKPGTQEVKTSYVSGQYEKLGDSVPTYNQLKKKYKDDIEQLGEDHEKLIEQILEDEEQLIYKHNISCKESIKVVEDEMDILKQVDKPGSDVESYVKKLDKILI